MLFYSGLETAPVRDFDHIVKLDLDLDLPPRYFEILIARVCLHVGGTTVHVYLFVYMLMVRLFTCLFTGWWYDCCAMGHPTGDFYDYDML